MFGISYKYQNSGIHWRQTVHKTCAKQPSGRSEFSFARPFAQWTWMCAMPALLVTKRHRACIGSAICASAAATVRQVEHYLSIFRRHSSLLMYSSCGAASSCCIFAFDSRLARPRLLPFFYSHPKQKLTSQPNFERICRSKNARHEREQSKQRADNGHSFTQESFSRPKPKRPLGNHVNCA